ncbi:MAG: SAM-dependent methyltransferase [Pseudomonadota bacterium]
MTGFSADWLSLREHADARARNAALAGDLAGHLARHQAAGEPLRVVDLGSGTAANLRALALRLDGPQHWHLLDDAPDLLDSARRTLSHWADEATPTPDGVDLVKDERRIRVSLIQADLSRTLSPLAAAAPHLVTASAFFDLVSAPFVEALAAACARLSATFFTVLTCDGRDGWWPAHPQDAAVAGAFRADQERDKGFGAALGNAASDHLATAFAAQGYEVKRADSAWRLDPQSDARDAALVAALAAGTAAAVADRIGRAAASDWAEARAGARCEIGHTDLLALPRPR